MLSSKLKILYVITSLRTGGAERLVTDLSTKFKEQAHEVEVLVFDGIHTPLMKELENYGIKIHKGGKGFFNIYNPLNIYKIKRLVKKNRYNIIHSHNTSAQFFTVLARLRNHAKLVTTEHNTFNKRRKLVLFKTFERFVYNRYDIVISVNETVKKNLLEYLNISRDNDCDKKKFPVVRNGIDLSKFTNKGKENKDAEIILMIAGFRKQKDHTSAIKAMLHLPDNYILWFAGEGPTKRMCQKQVKNLNLEERIKFLGNIEDIPSLISQVKIVILSSHHEGLPLSVIEAMSMGKPVIGSDVEGLQEIVEGAGILFEKGKEEHLAAKIKYLMESESEYKKVADLCRARGFEYDIKKCVDIHKQLYHKIISFI